MEINNNKKVITFDCKKTKRKKETTTRFGNVMVPAAHQRLSCTEQKTSSWIIYCGPNYVYNGLYLTEL